MPPWQYGCVTAWGQAAVLFVSMYRGARCQTPGCAAGAAPGRGATAPAAHTEERLRAWRPARPSGFPVRLARALSQRLYIVDTEEFSAAGGPSRTFKVLGSTGNIYTVVVGGEVRCNCPDGARTVCKHRIFILVRVLQAGNSSPLVYQDALVSSERAQLFGAGPAVSSAVAPEAVRAAYSSATGKTPPSPATASGGGSSGEPVHRGQASDDCPICFEELPGCGGDRAFEVCTSCKNGVHAECAAKWAAAMRGCGQQANCPHCRATWATNASNKAAALGPTTSGGFLKLG